MLSQPNRGWISFELDGTSVYELSYVTDIPTDWLNAAIDGLEHLRPFCVTGSLEPERLICVVSYWNCHLFVESQGGFEAISDEMPIEHSHTDMIAFCQMLHDDLSADINVYAEFPYWHTGETSAKVEDMRSKLEVLQELIDSKSEHFGPNRFFW